MPHKPIRFAALIRVSTEKQEKQGESLRTQQKQITQAVESLGGKITKTYAGQEHATAGWEREQLGQLLADAGRKRKPFDAVMVVEASRWSRDNASSKAGLQVFRDNGIRFFTMTTEHDLYDPSAILFLGMSAEIAEYHARQQKQKSLLSCIERAKRIGAPTSGKKPYGRLWDRKAEKWGVDPKKQAIIEDVAERYLAGESMPKLAQEYNINHSFLNKTLSESCGDRYTISWDVPDLNIKQSVEIKIPRLLPERTIKAIRQKAEANRTYQKGRPKYEYLLNGFVFCGTCGYSLTGQGNAKGERYYRHRTRSRNCTCDVSPKPYVRCDHLDDAVIAALFDTFGNLAGVERAIEQATPNMAKIKETRKKMAKLQADLEGIERSRNAVLTLVDKESISIEQAETKLNDIKSREALFNDKLEGLAASIDYAPSPEAIKATAKQVVESFSKPRVSARKRLAIRDANDLSKMTYADKRALVETVFMGRMPDGAPMGVYVDPIEGQENFRTKKWAFTLRGLPPVDGEQGVTKTSWG